MIRLANARLSGRRPAAPVFWIGLLGILITAVPASSQSWLSCEDTRYSAGDPADAFTSRYHLVQFYGGASVHSTNLFEDEYDGFVTSNEIRLAVPRLSEMVRTAVPLPDPYGFAVATRLTGIDWEDRLDFGGGLEWRPFKHARFESPLARWFYHVRLYATQHGTSYLQYRDEWAWRPNEDFRVGVELYRECNLYSGGLPTESPLWAEVWADASWRRTNFVVNDFRSWTVAVVPRVGVRVPAGARLALMPYLTGELAATGRSEPWQNRVLAGFGLRVMPFRSGDGPAAAILQGVRLYAEAVWVVGYISGASDPGGPSRDVRAGVAFQLNRY